MPEFDAIYKVLSTIIAVGALILAALLWRMRGEFASKTTSEANALRLAQLEKDMAVVNQRLDDLPSRLDLADVKEAVTALHGDHKALTATLEGVRQGQATLAGSVRRIEDYLLHGRGAE